MKTKRLLLIGLAIALVVTFCFAATTPTPPPPPPDRFGVWTAALNAETRLPEPFCGEWKGTQVPWLLTMTEVYFKMVPDGTGFRKVVDHTRVRLVDVQAHKIWDIEF